ncbi:hypothetical protein [Fervidibacter sacchari]
MWRNIRGFALGRPINRYIGTSVGRESNPPRLNSPTEVLALSFRVINYRLSLKR